MPSRFPKFSFESVPVDRDVLDETLGERIPRQPSYRYLFGL